MQELAQRLNDLCDQRPFKTLWYLKDLRTGQEADRDGHVETGSASTRKIAIMMTALKQVHEGKLSFDQELVVDDEIQKKVNNNPHGGCLQYFKPGLPVPLLESIIMMIIVSDNVSTGQIVDLVSIDNVNEFCKSIGMKNTNHRYNVPPTLSTPFDHALEETNTTSAADVGLLLDKINAGASDADAAAELGVSSELCQKAIEILSWQKFTTRLPAQLPPGASVAHKTGTGRRVANDAGIIFKDGKPLFVLTVYTDGVPNDQRDGPNGLFATGEHIAELSRTCWDALADA